ncbi:MAG: DnaA/Hda family protein, partial [Chlamydiota bacterium]
MKAWEDFLKKQEELLGKPIIDKWLRALKVLHFDSGNLYLEAKDSFQCIWFEEHIRPMLKRGLLNNNFRPIKVHLAVAQENGTVPQKKQKTNEKPPPPPQLEFPPDPLDPAATLDQFIIGESNEVLLRLLCELTGYDPNSNQFKEPLLALGTFNPIYLWGAPGMGKTHLLMALARAFQKRGLNALYARAETFTEHVVSAIRGSDMQSFRKAYRHNDILLIDDVHLLARKTATQEEFFHTFNALHTTGRQLILTANCAPSQLQEIEPRLVSRF